MVNGGTKADINQKRTLNSTWRNIRDSDVILAITNFTAKKEISPFHNIWHLMTLLGENSFKKLFPTNI